MKIIISVTNDLISDYRVHRTALTLQQKFDIKVILIGRKLKNSLPINTNPYKTIRFKLPFEKGPLFYILYTLTLFIYLLFQKTDFLWANDLDTLPANYLVSKLRRKKLIVDCHELFTEVPELIGRKRVRALWKWIERSMIPSAALSFTVCQSIADYYNSRYKLNMSVLRNVPERIQDAAKISLPEPFAGKKTVVYQGVVNIGRGLEKAIKAMQYIEDAVFLIIGDGDIMDKIRALVKELSLETKVYLTGRVPFSQLPSYIRTAHLGISLEENIGKNYYFALPNKLFAYIQAEIPVLVSDFPEMSKIVNGYGVGKTTLEQDSEKLADIIKEMLGNANQYAVWKTNLKKAAEELCWENEEKILIDRMKEVTELKKLQKLKI
jgi:glycosyltransferase involved in cell wall biosynthesis